MRDEFRRLFEAHARALAFPHGIIADEPTLRRQLSTAAIAQRLGISPRTVEGHIARATKALREQLPAPLSTEPSNPRSK